MRVFDVPIHLPLSNDWNCTTFGRSSGKFENFKWGLKFKHLISTVGWQDHEKSQTQVVFWRCNILTEGTVSGVKDL